MKNLLLVALLFMSIGFGWHFYGEIIKERVHLDEVMSTPFLVLKDALQIDDQIVDGAVLIKLLSISSRGFAVLQSDEQGPGKVIGVSELLEVGRKRNMLLEIMGEVHDGYAFVSLYKDDGDGVFNLENDIPLRGPSLAPVQSRIFLTVIRKEVKSLQVVPLGKDLQVAP